MNIARNTNHHDRTSVTCTRKKIYQRMVVRISLVLSWGFFSMIWSKGIGSCLKLD